MHQSAVPKRTCQSLYQRVLRCLCWRWSIIAYSWWQVFSEKHHKNICRWQKIYIGCIWLTSKVEYLMRVYYDNKVTEIWLFLWHGKHKSQLKISINFSLKTYCIIKEECILPLIHKKWINTIFTDKNIFRYHMIILT